MLEAAYFHVPAIKKIRLKNIGTFKDATLKFSSGLNIITGGGGSGKSTILYIFNTKVKRLF